MLNLKEQLKKDQQFGFDFMVNRESGKIKDWKNEIVTITNVDLMENVRDKMSGEVKDLIVFTIKEDNNHFFFGGNAITNMFKDFFEKYGKEATQHLVQNEGLEVEVLGKISKTFKTEYIILEIK